MQTTEHFGNHLPYIVSTPDETDTKKIYDVIILLHGYGASMYDLVGIAPAINQEDYIYVFLNAPNELNIGYGQTGYAWIPIGDSSEINQIATLINNSIEEFLNNTDYNIGKLYIGGFSQGGMMTIHVGLPSKISFEGAIILSSRMYPELKIELSVNDPNSTKIFMAHGIQDSVLPVADGRNTINHLTQMGFDLEFHEYNIGHEITLEVLEDLSNWLK